MTTWRLTEKDRELFSRDLESFVPPDIFDAHAHWYRTSHFPPNTAPDLVRNSPTATGAAVYLDAMARLLPGRRIEGLFFAYPHGMLNVGAANQFVLSEVRGRPGSRANLLVRPQDDPDWIREVVRQEGFAGLKCYHVFSNHRPTYESPIDDFLPEPQVEVAHEEGLAITLHIVRSRALADPTNQETIRRYCELYPGIRLILAHAGRGFNPHHTIQGVQALRGLPNLWFDTSAVTDSGAVEAIARTFGTKRLLYGSDFPVSQMRGRCVAVGDSFIWISAENTDLRAPYGRMELAFIGHESLRMLKVAALSLHWSDNDIENVFHNNARELFPLRGQERRALPAIKPPSDELV